MQCSLRVYRCMNQIRMEVTMSDVEGAWEMEPLVEGAVSIPAGKDYYKHCSTTGEGGNTEAWVLGVLPRVVQSPGDFPLPPPYRGL